MNYWIFKANPEHYDIDGRLLDPAPEIIWAVTRYHDRILPRDTVFIWRAGTPRGICAVMTIDACPYQPQEKDLHPGKFDLPAGRTAPAPEHWAKAHFIKRFPVIDTTIIKKIPGLELFSFFSAFQQAVNFLITRPEGMILLEFIEQYLQNGPAAKREPAPKLRKPAVGRVTSPSRSKPVEPAKKSTPVALLKCKTCGRYVVSTDTDRHVREAHPGQSVEWQKTK